MNRQVWRQFLLAFTLFSFYVTHAQPAKWVGCLKSASNFYLKAQLTVTGTRFSGTLTFLKYSVNFPIQGEIVNGNQIEFHIDFYKLDDLTFKGTLAQNEIRGVVSSKIIPGRFWLVRYEPTSNIEKSNSLIGWYELPGNKQMQLTWGSESFLAFTDYESPVQHSLMPRNDSTYFVWGDTLNNPLYLKVQKPIASSGPRLTWFDGRNEFALKRVRPELKEERIKISAGNISIVGTLHYKQSPVKHPLLILIQGSGSVGKDNFYYLQLVNFFVSKGFAAFVYDKRGVGESTGSWHTASYQELAGDMAAVVKALKTNPVIDHKNIISFGFSQGGDIAPIVSLLSTDISLVVNAMGSATPAPEQEIFDIKNECEEIKVNETEKLEIDNLLAKYFSYARGEGNWNDYARLADDSKSKKWFVCAGIPPQSEDDWRVKFWKANVNFDGSKIFENVTVPSLIIFGGKDNNVPTEESIENLKELINSKQKTNLEIKEYSKLGHILQLEQLEFVNKWVVSNLMK